MESLEPVINLLVVLTVLSVAAERITNALKLRHSELRTPTQTPEGEKKREEQITYRGLTVGILLAIFVKANIFEILGHLDTPWETLGWVQVSGSQWFRDPSTANWGAFLYALGGSAITGIALGFGSKFWHDILDTVFELRGMAKRAGQKTKATAGARAGAASPRRGGGTDG